MPKPNVFIGRQPIVDARERIKGYEILYRSSADSQVADFDDQDQASTEVVIRTFMELGPDAAFGTGKGYFNATAGVLEAGYLEVLPPERVVIELLESIEPTPQIVMACDRLRKMGFTLALDDYVPGDAREELLSLVDWVKVDLIETDPKKLRRLVRRLRRSGVHLLAEKVSSQPEFQRCISLGFDLFQGFHFSRPEIVSGCAPTHQNTALLDLMAKLQTGEETQEIAQTLKRHADLGVGLLRIANSAAMARAQSLSRIEDALVYLGRRQLQRWLAILLFSQNRPNGFLDPLLVLAAKRGRLLELLAAELNPDPDWTERAFLVGLLASADILLGRSRQEILDDLQLDEESRAALLGYEGDLGALLRIAEASESCDFTRLEDQLSTLAITQAAFQEAENSAYEWFHNMSGSLAA